MQVKFIGTEMETFRVLITEVQAPLRLYTKDGDEIYDLNFDSDGDGEDDAILAEFTFDHIRGQATGGPLYEFVNGRNVSIAHMYDYTALGKINPYSDEIQQTPQDVPTAFLGSAYRDDFTTQRLDWVAGNDGNDAITGGYQAQTFLGGAGNDRLSGMGGDDVLDGGSGRDKLIGGTGADRFVFDTLDARDVVADFSHAQGDRIDLTAFAPGLHLVDAFTGTGPELRLDDHARGRTALIFDTNGDGVEDGRIAFLGHPPLTDADFIFA